MLVKDYYIIEQKKCIEGVYKYSITLNRDCCVYKGHFPGTPVSPGVCNIQMVKECAEDAVGKQLFMNNLQLCRLTTLVTPVEHTQVDVTFTFTQEPGIYKLKATIGRDEDIYLDMKAELVNQE